MVSPAEHIDRLEFQIEELRISIARSRKLSAVGRFSALAGVLLLTSWLVGIAALSVAWMLMAIALTLGGVVLAGASKGSTEELQKALVSVQQLRTEAIDVLALTAIGDG